MLATIIILVFSIIAGRWAIEEFFPFIAIPCIIAASVSAGTLVGNLDVVAGFVLAILMFIGGIVNLFVYDD